MINGASLSIAVEGWNPIPLRGLVPEYGWLLPVFNTHQSIGRCWNVPHGEAKFRMFWNVSGILPKVAGGTVMTHLEELPLTPPPPPKLTGRPRFDTRVEAWRRMPSL